MTDGEAVDSFAHPHQNRLKTAREICSDALQSAFIFSREKLVLQSSHATVAIGLLWVVYDQGFSNCTGLRTALYLTRFIKVYDCCHQCHLFFCNDNSHEHLTSVINVHGTRHAMFMTHHVSHVGPPQVKYYWGKTPPISKHTLNLISLYPFLLLDAMLFCS